MNILNMAVMQNLHWLKGTFWTERYVTCRLGLPGHVTFNSFRATDHKKKRERSYSPSLPFLWLAVGVTPTSSLRLDQVEPSTARVMITDEITLHKLLLLIWIILFSSFISEDSIGKSYRTLEREELMIEIIEIKAST